MAITHYGPPRDIREGETTDQADHRVMLRITGLICLAVLLLVIVAAGFWMHFIFGLVCVFAEALAVLAVVSARMASHERARKARLQAMKASKNDGAHAA